MATSYTLYQLWNFLTHEQPTAPVIVANSSTTLVKPTEGFFMRWGTWLFDSSKFFATLCAQQLMIGWVLSKLMHDPSLNGFIAKNVSYKIHGVEIDKYLKMLAIVTEQAQRERCEFLTVKHLQLIVDKTGLLMAYLLYYARDEASSTTRAMLELYVTITLTALEHEVTRFNQMAQDNVASAAETSRKVLIDLLSSSVHYARSALPLDNEAVIWN
jgi:hypothetical protein